ncbi:DUF5305 family protein [Peptococcaceae bacterium 1198_IL3148]
MSIFKKHGTRFVALDKKIDSSYYNYNQVSSIEDLVKIADDRERPITYQYSANIQINEENAIHSLNETHYIISIDTENDQFEPDVMYNAYLYDIDTKETIIGPINFTVEIANGTSGHSHKE